MTSPERPPDPHPPAETSDPATRAAMDGQQPAPPSDGSDFITLSTPHRDSRDAVTWPVRVAAAWSWRLLVVAAGAANAFVIEKDSVFFRFLRVGMRHRAHHPCLLRGAKS